MGQPLKDIDGHKVEELASRFWSIAEIAVFFKVSAATIHNRFKEELSRGRESGKAILRDLQWQAAKRGDTKMILHMSKHHLGEHDRTIMDSLTDAELLALVQARIEAATKPQLAQASRDIQNTIEVSQSLLAIAEPECVTGPPPMRKPKE